MKEPGEFVLLMGLAVLLLLAAWLFPDWPMNGLGI
jgi:hypothetical protein